MVASTEIRWFFTGRLPSAMEKWFQSMEAASESTRTDYYLRYADNTSLGVKLREGQMQLKYKTEDIGPRKIDKAEGIVEAYEKWSFPADEQPEWELMMKDPKRWIAIDKTRMMLKFEYTHGEISRVSQDKMIASGCGVELSSILIGHNTPYWSLAFEAFGAGAGGSLQATLDAVLGSGKCPEELSSENSFGYAQLITDIKL